jgi:hypothetical protein
MPPFYCRQHGNCRSAANPRANFRGSGPSAFSADNKTATAMIDGHTRNLNDLFVNFTVLPPSGRLLVRHQSTTKRNFPSVAAPRAGAFE